MEGGGRGSSSRIEGEDRRGRRCVKRAAKVNGHFLSSRTEPPRGRITLFFFFFYPWNGSASFVGIFVSSCLNLKKRTIVLHTGLVKERIV